MKMLKNQKKQKKFKKIKQPRHSLRPQRGGIYVCKK